MFKLIAILCLLVVGCYAKKISIASKGAYVARCFINVSDGTNLFQLASGSIYAGQTKDMSLDEAFTQIDIRCENQRFVGVWGDLFSQKLNTARSLCYTLAGTTFHPSYEASIC